MLIVGRGVIRLVYEPVVIEGDPEVLPVGVAANHGCGEVAWATG